MAVSRVSTSSMGMAMSHWYRKVSIRNMSFSVWLIWFGCKDSALWGVETNFKGYSFRGSCFLWLGRVVPVVVNGEWYMRKGDLAGRLSWGCDV